MSESNSQNTYDYIVVGGGSAGCVVAGRLAESNAGSVLLLEGYDQADAHPETLTSDGFRNAFANDALILDRMSEPQRSCGNRTIFAGSGKGMGGSGSVNGMVYTRGDKLDYAQWPDGWHWDDVAPAFQKLEQSLRVRPRQATTFTEIALRVSEAAGFRRKHGLNDGQLNGFMGYNDMNMEAGKRRNSYVAFVAEQTSTNLTVQTNAKVYKVIFNDARQAIGVDVVVHGRLQRFMATKEIILCAGALETPKLLMLSGVGPRQHLESMGIQVLQDIPSIGSNLQDHPNVALMFKGKRQIDFGYPQIYGFFRGNPQLNLPAEQADTCIAWFAAHRTLQQTMMRTGPAMMLRGKNFFSPRLRKAIRIFFSTLFLLPPVNTFISKIYGLVVILGKPVSRGSIRLASCDVNDPALIDLAYYQDDADIETMINGVKVAQRIANDAGLVAWGNKALIPDSMSDDRDKIKAMIHKLSMTTFHYCGTCTMGDDIGSPVDSKLRLKGFGKIRIADASVIPVVPVSALNAPSMMIGYRLADFILAENPK